MTNTRHTQGPWSRNEYGQVIDPDGASVFFRSVTVLASGASESVVEAEANTTLLATAPEMLEILQHVLDYGADGEAIRERIKDTISKATK